MEVDTLVLSGGSLKGISILGALTRVAEVIDLTKIQTYVGTSVGTMIGYLLAIGYSPFEIKTKLFGKSFFKNKLVITKRNIALFDFDVLLEELEVLTLAKVLEVPTLGELESKYKKELVCIVYNYTQDMRDILSSKTKPHLSCLTALQMSCALPVIFGSVTSENQCYFDGGLADNFPVEIALELGKTHLLGIAVFCDCFHGNTDPIYIKLINLILSLITQKMESTYNHYRHQFPLIRVTCNLPLAAIEVADDEIETLIQSGYSAAKLCLEHWEAEKSEHMNVS